jgi:cellulose synthase/poly-beta-1,6-N-acetylglucosamine synthase-like glycosyltransferase
MNQKENQPVSVVVIGRNEGARLARCLDSIRQMRFPASDVELIYVDSASKDDSTQIAASRNAQVIVLNAGRPCAAKARNAGWRASSAPLVFFLDGDTIVHPDFLTKAMESLRTKEIGVVWGHRRELKPRQSIYTGVLDLDWIWPAGDSLFCGGDALMRRSVLEATGGFDDTLIAGEEPELCRRIREMGYRILHIDCQMTGHDLAVTRFRQYWNRSVRTGHAYAEIASRFQRTRDPLWLAEQRRNIVQGLGYAILILGSVAIGIARLTLWPLAITVLIFVLLAVRTAMRNRSRTSSLKLLFAHGIHSHLQQIPILLGQAGYWWSRFAGKRRHLIEYREEA